MRIIDRLTSILTKPKTIYQPIVVEYFFNGPGCYQTYEDPYIPNVGAYVFCSIGNSNRWKVIAVTSKASIVDGKVLTTNVTVTLSPEPY
jgi:hypothetical protein